MEGKKLKAEARISTAEAERAVYIDFEGIQDHPPALLGILVGEHLEQVVLDVELEAAAVAKQLRLALLLDEMNRLLDLCRREERLIVAYSQHEKNVVRDFAGLDLTGSYRDARMIAKRWKAIRHPAAPIEGRGLKDFLKFINYERGAYLGERKSTSRLEAVRAGLRTRNGYAANASDESEVDKAAGTQRG